MMLLDEWVEILFLYDAEGKPALRDSLTRAIIDYICLGKVPEFEDESLKLIWRLLQPQAEHQRKKTQKKLACRRNGKKGGRPRKDGSKSIRNN